MFVYIVIVNGDLELLKFLIEKCSVDVYVCVWGRFFMLEDCKDKMKIDIDYDGEWKEFFIFFLRKKVFFNEVIDV